MLSPKEFRDIVKNTPLVAIDLIIEDSEGKVLLGWRNNSPAKACWFVPGGRIRKDEHFTDAFERIIMAETGLTKKIEDAGFIGLYEHLYPGDNYSGEHGFGTHYIVIAFRIRLGTTPANLPKEQHAAYCWMAQHELLEKPDVHQNTKNYFNGHRSLSEY